MLLDSYNGFPSIPIDTTASFSVYPLSTRSKTHQNILHPSTTSSSGGSVSGADFQIGQAGPGPSTLSSQQATRDRVMAHALMGKRPWGVGLGKDSEELEDEEAAQEQESHGIGMFGHRFLLPFGRRQTQMELDAAPSPSPSQVDDDRRQEDRNEGVSPTIAVQIPNQPVDEEDEAGNAVDLDASIEDLDASIAEDPDGMDED